MKAGNVLEREGLVKRGHSNTTFIPLRVFVYKQFAYMIRMKRLGGWNENLSLEATRQEAFECIHT